MTNEEAKDLLDNLIGMVEDNQNNDYDEALKLGIEALEKQIPKEPTPINWEQYKDKVINADYMRNGFWCPNCKHIIKCGNYCLDCGQALKWK